MYRAISGLAAAIILVFFSIRCLDIRIANFIFRHAGSGFLFSRSVSSLPDMLLLIVIVVTAFCWAAYFHLAKRNITDRRTLYFKILGTSLPLAYAAKDVLKWIFGRVDTRTWLTSPVDAFHWFSGEHGFDGFPSGHMLVLTPIFLVLWEAFPKFRAVFLTGWLGLALALMITEYHFLGDVIAGAYIGFLFHCGTSRSFKSRH